MHAMAPEHGNCYFCTAWGLTNSVRQPFFADLCAFTAGPDAIFHTTDLFAALHASITDLGANPTNVVVKGGTTQQEIGRRLTDLGAVDH